MRRFSFLDPSMRPRFFALAHIRFAWSINALAAIAALAGFRPSVLQAEDKLRDLQVEYYLHTDEKLPRAFHFGSQKSGDVYSNYGSHSNRMVPIYTFGTRLDLASVTGPNSSYRNPQKLEKIYGYLPPNTLNPTAEYCDQSELYQVQKQAVERGLKHLFIVWFDGLDWPTTQAAAIARTGHVYTSGKGSGLLFQDYAGAPKSEYGYAVTSPTHTHSVRNVDLQTVTVDPKTSAPGGYDPEIAGPNPWTTGPLYESARGYFREKMGNDDRNAIIKLGRVAHGVTDSAPSAGEFASGVKSYNTSINVAPNGQCVPTLFNQLQIEKGWKVGVVTSVGISDASPSAMYAHNVDRDDSQDLTRELLGLESIVQKTGKNPRLPGLDVLIGAGFGEAATAQNLARSQGANAEAGNPFLAPSDRAKIDIKNGGKYVVAETTHGEPGARVLDRASHEAANTNARLFGFFGTSESHLPWRTTDGRYDPVSGRASDGKSVPIGTYSEAHLNENPKLADMTRAAITVLSADPAKPFALFIEAGDVDWALHGNNLDSAIGCVYSGEDAVRAVIEWIEKNSNWNDSALIVTADHGHYLVIDNPQALVPTK